MSNSRVDRLAAVSDEQFRDNPVAAGADILCAAGIPGPRFEAQILLAYILGMNRAQVLAGLHGDLDNEQMQRYRELVLQRSRRIPLAYVRGTQEFYGLSFVVNSSVLIPRPETELLVEFALEKARDRSDRFVVADVGAGSGCIAIALGEHLAHAQILAIDISAEALACATLNLETRSAKYRVRLVHGNLLAGVRASTLDTIVSNPPYIPTTEIAELEPEVSRYEPRCALDGGADGLQLHRKLVIQAFDALKPGGWLALEVAMGQAGDVAQLLSKRGYVAIERRRDLAGIDRVVAGQVPIQAPEPGAPTVSAHNSQRVSCCGAENIRSISCVAVSNVSEANRNPQDFDVTVRQ